MKDIDYKIVQLDFGIKHFNTFLSNISFYTSLTTNHKLKFELKKITTENDLKIISTLFPNNSSEITSTQVLNTREFMNKKIGYWFFYESFDQIEKNEKMISEIVTNIFDLFKKFELYNITLEKLRSSCNSERTDMILKNNKGVFHLHLSVIKNKLKK